MTDKEIIIDGVDVSKCKHFKAWYESRPNGFGGITIENTAISMKIIVKNTLNVYTEVINYNN